MANSESDDREADLSKKERLVNAWLAGGPEAKAKNIAEITKSSIGYASRIQTEMEEGEISEDDVEDIRDEGLVEQYSDQLERVARQEEEDETGEEEEGGAVTAETTAGEGADEEEGEQGETAQAQSQQRQQQVPQQQQPSPQRRQATQQAQQQHQPQQQRQQVQQPQQSRQPQSPPRQQRQAQQRAQRQQPTQQQPHHPQQQSQQAGQSRQQSPQQGLSAEGQRAVSVDQLQEIDRLLATYEEEAQYEIENLPQQYSAQAVGKLFVAQKTRSLLRNITGNGEGRQS